MLTRYQPKHHFIVRLHQRAPWLLEPGKLNAALASAQRVPRPNTGSLKHDPDPDYVLDCLNAEFWYIPRQGPKTPSVLLVAREGRWVTAFRPNFILSRRTWNSRTEKQDHSGAPTRAELAATEKQSLDNWLATLHTPLRNFANSLSFAGVKRRLLALQPALVALGDSTKHTLNPETLQLIHLGIESLAPSLQDFPHTPKQRRGLVPATTPLWTAGADQQTRPDALLLQAAALTLEARRRHALHQIPDRQTLTKAKTLSELLPAPSAEGLADIKVRLTNLKVSIAATTKSETVKPETSKPEATNPAHKELMAVAQQEYELLTDAWRKALEARRKNQPITQSVKATKRFLSTFGLREHQLSPGNVLAEIAELQGEIDAISAPTNIHPCGSVANLIGRAKKRHELLLQRKVTMSETAEWKEKLQRQRIHQQKMEAQYHLQHPYLVAQEALGRQGINEVSKLALSCERETFLPQAQALATQFAEAIEAIPKPRQGTSAPQTEEVEQTG